MNSRYFNRQYFSSGNTKTAGVAIFVTTRFKGKVERVVLDIPGRALILQITYTTHHFIVGTIYCPNTGQEQFLKTAIERIGDHPHADMIIGGDFNIVLDTTLDRSAHRRGQVGALSDATKAWLDDIGMVDVWRVMHPTERDYTYYSSSHLTYARLDRFLVTDRTQHRVSGTDIGVISISDHAPITLTITVPPQKYPGGQWRFNDWLLRSHIHVKEIRETIKEYLSLNDNTETSVATQWEALKAVVRGRCMAISASMNKVRKQKREELEQETRALEQEHKRTGARRIFRTLQTLRKELKALDWEAAEYALLRTRQRYHVSGNKAGRLLAQKLRAKAVREQIRELVTATGQPLLQETEIREEFRTFYSELYTREKVDTEHIQQYLEGVDLPRLTEKEAGRLEAEIRPEEVITAISRMPAGKAPGNDGYTAAYYKQFSGNLTPMLVKLFNSFVTEGGYPPTMREAIITVILKTGRDPRKCASYRPISLLNIDAKIFTSILASRLKPHMQGLVDPDQTGFIPERGCGDNTKRIFHLMDKISRAKYPALLLSVDAEKAFDRVHWPFLAATMGKMGLGQRFLNMVWCGYTYPSAKVRVNGVNSGAFPIQRGTRQGCPLSPLLYALYMEPFAESIRQQTNIHGIKFAQTDHKIALYADDVIVTLSEPETSIPTFLKEVSRFTRVSGFRMNEQKSEILNLTVPLDMQERIQGLTLLPWAKTHITYLGIQIHPTLNKTVIANYETITALVSRELSSWKTGGLSWLGRIAAVKMTVLPQILYTMQTIALEPPPGSIIKLQKLINAFIWEGKRPRMAYKQTYIPARKGGLGVPNMQKYYIAAQLRWITEWHRTESEKHWCFMDQSVAGIHIWKLLWLRKQHRPWGAYSSPVLRTTMKAWDSVALNKGFTTFPSPYSPIIGNPDFTPGMAEEDFREWQKGKCKHLGDIFDTDGIMSFDRVHRAYFLPEAERWRYIYVRHWALHPTVKPLAGRQFTPFERWLTNKDSDKRTLSDIYVLLTSEQTPQLPRARTQWAMEMEREITDKEWDDALTRIHTSTYSTSGRETSLKVLHYWYYTPARIQKWNRDSHGRCWRGCGQTGTLIHLLWNCPKLVRYWDQILGEIDEIFGIEFPRFPAYVLLGLPDRLAYPLHSRRGKSIAAALNAAIQTIVGLWGKIDPPEPILWKHRLWNLLGMEKIAAYLNNSWARFDKQWSTLIEYLSDEFRELTCPRYLRVMRLTEPHTQTGTVSSPPLGNS